MSSIIESTFLSRTNHSVRMIKQYSLIEKKVTKSFLGFFLVGILTMLRVDQRFLGL